LILNGKKPLGAISELVGWTTEKADAPAPVTLTGSVPVRINLPTPVFLSVNSFCDVLFITASPKFTLSFLGTITPPRSTVTLDRKEI
jgi:hypothetical protein